MPAGTYTITITALQRDPAHRMYFHKTLRMNYTTYDMRRDQDVINPRIHSDVMVLSHEDDETDRHPYWYARVLLIFHVFAQTRDINGILTRPKRVDVLWVRWFGRNLEAKAGWKAKRLFQVGFIPADNQGAFGFLDPDVVIRGVHLIPRFAAGCTTDLLGPSAIRNSSEVNEHWLYFFVNVFVDRDMVMRFRGGGVGHKTTRRATQCLAEDLDPLDDPDRMQDDSDEGDDTIKAYERLGWESDTEDDTSTASSEESRSGDDETDEEPLNEYDAEGYAEP